MSVVVVGLNHRHASVDQLERLAVSAEQAPKALRSLTERPHVAGAVVLSTCNRVEVYALVHRFHGGIADLRNFLCEWGGFAPEDLDGLTYEYHDERAASHLFSVACGLDSVVVGERQVARQVKQALLTARSEQACGSRLGLVFERALRVARRVRTGTRLSETASSMLDAGIAAARAHTGPLAQRTVLLVGAGKIGAMAARSLEPPAVQRLLVTNRTPDRADRLVERGAVAVPLDELSDALGSSDLVISSTASRYPIITRAVLDDVMRRRPDRPLVIVDLAVPRDVAGDCRDVPGVTVLDVDAVSAAVTADDATHDTGEAGNGGAAAEVDRARALVAEEVAALTAWQRARPVEPTVAALRRRAEDVRASELARLASRLGTLDQRQREAVEQLTRGIVSTLLHEPTVRLKAASDGDDAAHQAEVVRHLFDLDDVVDDA
ncbi:MAG TPA: glutamyl-tRNA reductase [Euzebyales bacterium]